MEEQLTTDGIGLHPENTEPLRTEVQQAAEENAADTLEQLGPEEVHKAVVLNAFDQTNLMQEILTTLKIVAQQQSALIQYLMK